jgi:GNAT superfamily N-acetyltransferase
MTMTIRLMGGDDIDFALRQTTREGWDSTAAGFRWHLAMDGDGCFIAERDGEPVGLVTSTLYRRSAFVGNLIVEPAYRLKGVGEMLMRRALQRVDDAGIKTTWLEADPDGEHLYRKLGFGDVFPSLRFQRPAGGAPGFVSAAAVRPIDAAHLPELAELDESIFGDDRMRHLELILAEAPVAFALVDHGKPIGYLLTQAMESGLRPGPGVARTADAAAALLDAVIAADGGQRIMIGVPEPNRDLPPLLSERGFEPRPPSLRMRRPPGGYDGQPQHVLAIAGGDRG